MLTHTGISSEQSWPERASPPESSWCSWATRTWPAVSDIWTWWRETLRSAIERLGGASSKAVVTNTDLPSNPFIRDVKAACDKYAEHQVSMMMGDQAVMRFPCPGPYAGQPRPRTGPGSHFCWEIQDFCRKNGVSHEEVYARLADPQPYVQYLRTSGSRICTSARSLDQACQIAQCPFAIAASGQGWRHPHPQSDYDMNKQRYRSSI